MKNVNEMWKAIKSFRQDDGKDRYSMKLCEWKALAETGHVIDVASNAFNYGFIKGIRYQKAQEKKKRQAVKV